MSVRRRFHRTTNPSRLSATNAPPSNHASGATAMEFLPALVTLF